MNIEILETTLRDGSYTIDFRFTPEDTSLIASALEGVGFRLIEVGHGLGLNAREMGKGDAAAGDAEYLEAAARVLGKAKFGMFCIPGIARLEDIDMAAELGMKFIRIGTNITELESAADYFERARKHDMYTFSNLMKSYAVPPSEFGKYAKLAQQYGADIVVLVDSAGGLFPKDIEDYFKASQDTCSVPLGFHGHNNLGLANANTLRAAECGAAVVDTSLKGMGRSAGNAVTEMVVLILKKIGYQLDIDEYKVMDLAEKYITPLIRSMKDTPISITGGYAQFHSSFLGTILEYAEKYRVDPRELIVRVTEKDKINAPPGLVEDLAAELKEEKDSTTSTPISPHSFKLFLDSGENREPKNQMKVLISEITNRKKKKCKESVLNIVLSDSDKNENYISNFIQESPLYVVGSMEISEYEFIRDLMADIKDNFDYVLLDNSIKREDDKGIVLKIIEYLKNTRLLMYNDLSVWARCVTSVLTALLGNLMEKRIVVYGNNKLAHHISYGFGDSGAHLWQPGKKSPPDRGFLTHCHAVISCDRKNKLKKDFFTQLNRVDIVIDAKIDSIDETCIDFLNQGQVKLLRPDMRSAIAGEILHQISNYNLVKNDMKRETFKGHNVISGGLIGKSGEVVVDSVSSPTQVIGIAQGNGKVRYTFNNDEKKIVEEIQAYINTEF